MNADGSRILEFADGLNLVICNTLFTKQEAKLVTYVAGPVKSTVDYIMVRLVDKAKVHNIKVISSDVSSTGPWSEIRYKKQNGKACV